MKRNGYLKNIMRYYLKIILLAITLSSFMVINAQTTKEEIPCEEINIGCLILGRDTQGEHIIRNSTEYQDLIQSRSPNSNCGNYQLPNIDFNNYTLIGYISSAAGCKSPIVTHQIIKINNNYTINITVNQQGLCLRNNPITIWCLIPKVKKEETVQFNIDIQQTN